MSAEEYFELVEKLKRIRTSEKAGDSGNTPPSLAFLTSTMQNETDPERRRMLYHLYYRECADLDRDDLAIALARDEVKEFPGEPVPKTGLAMALARHGDLDAAAEIAGRAVADSIQSNRFINLALLTQIRIAVMNHDYSQVEQSLRSLIAYRAQPREEDCRLEGEFLADLPSNVLDRRLRAEYEALLK